VAFPLNLDDYQAVIAAGQSLSGPVLMGADTLVAISMPSSWVNASLTFQASPDGGTTWQELYDGAGNEITVVAAANQFIALSGLPSYVWRGINALQVRSGTLAAPVVQTAGATITLIGRPEMY
jgi:hypothetical protein